MVWRGRNGPSSSSTTQLSICRASWRTRRTKLAVLLGPGSLCWCRGGCSCFTYSPQYRICCPLGLLTRRAICYRRRGSVIIAVHILDTGGPSLALGSSSCRIWGAKKDKIRFIGASTLTYVAASRENHTMQMWCGNHMLVDRGCIPSLQAVV